MEQTNLPKPSECNIFFTNSELTRIPGVVRYDAFDRTEYFYPSRDLADELYTRHGIEAEAGFFLDPSDDPGDWFKLEHT